MAITIGQVPVINVLVNNQDIYHGHLSLRSTCKTSTACETQLWAMDYRA